MIRCETPKSPPGDYNENDALTVIDIKTVGCETPKSPPGDYNRRTLAEARAERERERVKHLNPRQGITTNREASS